MYPHPRARCPSGQNGFARAMCTHGAEDSREHAGIGSEARAQHERACPEDSEARNPFQRLTSRGRLNVAGLNRTDSVALLARRRQDRQDTHRHQRGHHGIREIPAVGFGEQQRDCARDDDRDPVAPLIRCRHRALLGNRRRFDAPGVDGNVLRGRREADENRKDRYRAETAGWIGTRHEPEPQHDEPLAHQHPRPAMTQPAGENGDWRPVDERRPEKLEGRDQCDQAEEADHFEGEAGRAQPGRQRVEDKKVGQSGREAERHHDQRGPLGVHAERRTDRAPARRGFGFHTHATSRARVPAGDASVLQSGHSPSRKTG